MSHHERMKKALLGTPPTRLVDFYADSIFAMIRFASAAYI
jgi:hypothetical protein